MKITTFIALTVLGSSAFAKVTAPVTCDASMSIKKETLEEYDLKIRLVDFTYDYMCGNGEGAKKTKEGLAACRKLVKENLTAKYSSMSREEFLAHLQTEYRDLIAAGVLNVEKALAKGIESLVQALFSDRVVTGHMRRKVSAEGTVALEGVEFSSLVESFKLTPVDSVEGKEIAAKYPAKFFRVVSLSGVKYFEPAYDEGFKLGKLEHLAAAKNAVPGAIEVLGNNHAKIGSTMGNMHIRTEKGKETRLRLLMVLTNTGDYVAVLQTLTAPTKSEAPAVPANISLIRQEVIPADGRDYQFDFTAGEDKQILTVRCDKI